MAKAIDTRNPFSALLSRRGASVIPSPAPREPHVLAMIVAGIRCFEIRGVSASGPVSAHWHQRDGGWFDLARDVSFADAIAAINRFIDLVWDLAPGWSAERDASEMAAVAAVRSGEADAIVLPLAA